VADLRADPWLFCMPITTQLKKHFLFYSADITPEREAYLKKNKLRFLRKPFALGEFMDTIDQLIRQ